MTEQGKISIRQLKILSHLLCLGSTILIIPSPLSSEAKQDAWMSAILGVAMGLLLIMLYGALGRRYPNQSLMEYSEVILGKWIGKAVAIMYASFFFLLSAIILRNMGDFISTIIMPETPIQAIHIIFMIGIIIAARLGIEVIGRTSELMLPFVFAFVIVLLCFITPQAELNRIQPVLEFGILPVIQGSFALIGIPFLEFVVFLMVIPYVNKQEKASKAIIIGALVGGVIVILFTALSVLVLGWDFTARHTYPTYTLAKKIRLGEFLQRIEVFVGVVWIITMFFKLSVFYYASVLGVAQIFKMDDYRPLVWPLGMIAVTLSLIVYPNLVYFRTFIHDIWTSYAMTFGLLLPLLLLAVSMLRSKISLKR